MRAFLDFCCSLETAHAWTRRPFQRKLAVPTFGRGVFVASYLLRAEQATFGFLLAKMKAGPSARGSSGRPSEVKPRCCTNPAALGPPSRSPGRARGRLAGREQDYWGQRAAERPTTATGTPGFAPPRRPLLSPSPPRSLPPSPAGPARGSGRPGAGKGSRPGGGEDGGRGPGTAAPPSGRHPGGAPRRLGALPARPAAGSPAGEAGRSLFPAGGRATMAGRKEAGRRQGRDTGRRAWRREGKGRGTLGKGRQLEEESAEGPQLPRRDPGTPPTPPPGPGRARRSPAGAERGGRRGASPLRYLPPDSVRPEQPAPGGLAGVTARVFKERVSYSRGAVGTGRCFSVLVAGFES